MAKFLIYETAGGRSHLIPMNKMVTVVRTSTTETQVVYASSHTYDPSNTDQIFDVVKISHATEDFQYQMQEFLSNMFIKLAGSKESFINITKDSPKTLNLPNWG